MSEIKWEPCFYADMDDSEEDSDYLREQDCCTSCGAYIGDLPGYYYIDSDCCPTCREQSQGLMESWSEELQRLAKEYDYDIDSFKSYLSKCEELGI